MKNFNFFEKLWEHSRTLRRVGLVLVMCLTIGIGNVWGTSDIQQYTRIYFDNSKANWNYSKVYLCANDEQIYEMTKIDNTKLYWFYYTNGTWSKCPYVRVIATSSSWSVPGGWDNIHDNAANATNTNNSYNYNKDCYSVIQAQKTGSVDDLATITVTYLGNTSAWGLNKTITIRAKVMAANANSYSDTNTPGALSASSYKFTADGSCSSGTSGSLSAGSSYTTFEAGYTATTTLTAASATNHKFIGWYDASGNLISTNATCTVYPTSNTTYYAYYDAMPTATLTLPDNGGSMPSPSSGWLRAYYLYNTQAANQDTLIFCPFAMITGTSTAPGWVKTGVSSGSSTSVSGYNVDIFPGTASGTYKSGGSTNVYKVYSSRILIRVTNCTEVRASGNSKKNDGYIKISAFEITDGTWPASAASSATGTAANTVGVTTLSGLTAGKEYLLVIEGTNKAGDNQVGEVALFSPANVSCSATQPGTISKGTLSGCTMRLTASGSPASNNTWYWQASSTGTSTSESGATKDVTTPGTYYIRSYCSDGTGCWSEAQLVTVSASDLTPAAPTALAASSVTAKGVTLTVTDAANTNDYEFYVSTSSSAPEGSTPATHSSNTKSITITNLYAGTTFYAWARAKCGSNKSAWTALTDDSFETSTVSVTHTLTNVTETSSAATSGVGGSDYEAVYEADEDYALPTPVVTIGGNTATSGTDYTWTAGTGTISIPANKITGNIVITMNSAAAAPTNVAITGNYHIYPGDDLELTATPTGGNGPKTYQWQKLMGYDWTDIDDETSNTYTKASVTTSDVGHYRCIVTCGGTASYTSGQFDVKCLQLYVYYNDNKDLTNVPFTKVNGTSATATVLLSNGTYDYRFKITDGCGNWWGNNGASGMSMSNHDNWPLNGNHYTILWTSKAGTYRFNLGHDVGLTSYGMSVVFPSGNQAAGYNLYFANDETEWNGSKIYYRIGKTSHNNFWQMNLVPGTANLYKVTTTEYGGFEAWHIANNRCGGNSTSIYKTNTNDDYEASAAMMFNGTDIASTGLTVIPDTSNHWAGTGDGADCEFYGYNTVDGMLTHTATISDMTNGSVRLNWTDVSGTAQNATATTAGLAHTCNLQVTALPATGYETATLTVNGSNHTSGNVHVLKANATIAATFSLVNYNVTYSAPSNGNYTIKVADGDASSATKTATMGQTVHIAATGNTGYEFSGWTITKTSDASDVTSSVSLSGQTAEATFTMPAYGVTVYATFAAIDYDITHSDASNGSYTIKVASGDATGSSTTANYGQTITLTATPSSGYVFDHWTTSGTSVTLGNANVESTTFTMPAGDVTIGAVFKLKPNVYYYGDQYDSENTKWLNPEGEEASSGDNKNLTTPWTICNACITGVTSVKATNGQYDGKGTYMNSYIKLATGGNATSKNIEFIIASGYTATISMKIGGYSSNPTVTLKSYDGESLGDDISKASGYATVGGVATTENNFKEIRWSSLTAGTYILNVGTNNAYISEIDIQTESLGYAITKSATNGTISTKVSGSEVTYAEEGDEVYLTATPNTGYEFRGWTVLDESDERVSVTQSWKPSAHFTMPGEAVTVSAEFTQVNYAIMPRSIMHFRYTVQVGEAEAVDGYARAHYGDVITLAQSSIADGYHLKTWGVTKTESGDEVTMASTNTFVMPAEDVTINPIVGKWYTVSFDANTGNDEDNPDPITQTAVDGAITMPAAPTKSGYTFVNWMIGGTTVDAGGSYTPPTDVTAYATWKENCAGGGGGSTTLYAMHLTAYNTYAMDESTTGSATLAFADDNIITISTVNYYKPNSTNAIVATLGAGIALQAGDIISFTLASNDDSEKTVGFTLAEADKTEARCTVSVSATKATPVIGRCTIPAANSLIGASKLYCNRVSAQTRVHDLQIIRPSAGSCKYVIYDGNGAAGGYTNDETAYSSGATVTVATTDDNHFSHPGYTFTGWNTQADGKGTGYAAGATFSISENTTLYAQWTPATLYFTRAVDGDWTDPLNWKVSGGDPGCIPTIEHDVVIQGKVTLYGPYAEDRKGHGVAKSVRIEFGKNVEIWTEGGLIVAEDIKAKHAVDGEYEATTPDDLSIETTILGNGTLITGEENSTTQALYKFRTKAFTCYVEQDGKRRKYYYNQYCGIPFQPIDPMTSYYGCTIYEYGAATDSWITPTTAYLQPFVAYNLLRKNAEDGDDIWLRGTLNLPGIDGEKLLECGWRDDDTESTIDANKAYQDFMFANSWTAPIDISSLDEEDCSDNLVQSIYMFNTGYEREKGVKEIGNKDGQWSVFPFKAGKYMKDAVIPGTQAFLVTAMSSGASLTLKYGKHVYTPALEAGGANNFPTRAPKRAKHEEIAPNKLLITVLSDNTILDNMYIFEREDFTEDFDNGWDGTKIIGSTRAPQLYARQGNNKMEVAAVPEMEGLEIGFIAGTDTNSYAFEFEYLESEPLYLYDRETMEYTPIENKGTYSFSTEDNEDHARFVLTRSKAPMTATGIESVKKESTSNKVSKVLINDHIYIIRGGKTYSVDGALVK